MASSTFSSESLEKTFSSAFEKLFAAGMFDLDRIPAEHKERILRQIVDNMDYFRDQKQVDLALLDLSKRRGLTAIRGMSNFLLMIGQIAAGELLLKKGYELFPPQTEFEKTEIFSNQLIHKYSLDIQNLYRKTKRLPSFLKRNTPTHFKNFVEEIKESFEINIYDLKPAMSAIYKAILGLQSNSDLLPLIQHLCVARCEGELKPEKGSTTEDLAALREKLDVFFRKILIEFTMKHYLFAFYASTSVKELSKTLLGDLSLKEYLRQFNRKISTLSDVFEAEEMRKKLIDDRYFEPTEEEKKIDLLFAPPETKPTQADDEWIENWRIVSAQVRTNPAVIFKELPTVPKRRLHTLALYLLTIEREEEAAKLLSLASKNDHQILIEQIRNNIDYSASVIVPIYEKTRLKTAFQKMRAQLFAIEQKAEFLNGYVFDSSIPYSEITAEQKLEISTKNQKLIEEGLEAFLKVSEPPSSLIPLLDFFTAHVDSNPMWVRVAASWIGEALKLLYVNKKVLADFNMLFSKANLFSENPLLHDKPFLKIPSPIIPEVGLPKEIKEEPKENPKEELKQDPKENSKEELKEPHKDKLKEDPKEELKQDAKENSKEELKEPHKEELKENPKEELKDEIKIDKIFPPDDKSSIEKIGTSIKIDNSKNIEVEEKTLSTQMKIDDELNQIFTKARSSSGNSLEENALFFVKIGKLSEAKKLLNYQLCVTEEEKKLLIQKKQLLSKKASELKTDEKTNEFLTSLKEQSKLRARLESWVARTKSKLPKKSKQALTFFEKKCSNRPFSFNPAQFEYLFSLFDTIAASPSRERLIGSILEDYLLSTFASEKMYASLHSKLALVPSFITKDQFAHAKLKRERKKTPKAEAPKAEAPKAEAPKAEAPKAEAPKAEAPKAEAPKAEAPKAGTPKTESPEVEPSKTEHMKLFPEVITKETEIKTQEEKTEKSKIVFQIPPDPLFLVEGSSEERISLSEFKESVTRLNQSEQTIDDFKMAMKELLVFRLLLSSMKSDLLNPNLKEFSDHYLIELDNAYYRVLLHRQAELYFEVKNTEEALRILDRGRRCCLSDIEFDKKIIKELQTQLNNSDPKKLTHFHQKKIEAIDNLIQKNKSLNKLTALDLGNYFYEKAESHRFLGEQSQAEKAYEASLKHNPDGLAKYHSAKYHSKEKKPELICNKYTSVTQKINTAKEYLKTLENKKELWSEEDYTELYELILVLQGCWSELKADTQFFPADSEMVSSILQTIRTELAPLLGQATLLYVKKDNLSILDESQLKQRRNLVWNALSTYRDTFFTNYTNIMDHLFLEFCRTQFVLNSDASKLSKESVMLFVTDLEKHIKEPLSSYLSPAKWKRLFIDAQKMLNSQGLVTEADKWKIRLENLNADRRVSKFSATFFKKQESLNKTAATPSMSSHLKEEKVFKSCKFP